MNLTTLTKLASTAAEATNGGYGNHINADSTFAERALFGGEVMLIGMAVVFGVLLLLIGILQLFKLFGNKEAKVKEETAKPAAPVAPVATAVPATGSNEEESVVAIATAAIAAYRGESDCAFNIISIKKIVK